MAEKTFIVKLAGNSKSYQSSMSQASKALDNFQKQNLSSGAAVKTLTSSLSKYISVAAIAKGAFDAISKTIKSSQESADYFAATMHGAKAAVDTFFSSLSTGDFTAFALGLNTIAQNAEQAYLALDRLGNASMSWNYFSSARMADLTELQAILNDTNRPMEERQAALNGIKAIQKELSEDVQGYTQRAMEAMAREMSASTMLEWKNISRADLEKVLKLDLLELQTSETKKNELSAAYAEYQAKVSKLKDYYEKNYRKLEWVNKVTPSGQTYSTLEDVTPQKDRQRFEAQQRMLASEYQDAILFNETLKRKSDEWLKNLIAIVQQADNAARSMRRVNNAVTTGERTLNGSAVPVIPTSPETPMGAPPAFKLGQSAGLAQSTFEPMKKLPEMERTLTNVNGILYDMNGSVISVTDSLDRMGSTAEGINAIGNAFESLGSLFSSMEDDSMKKAGRIISTVGAVVEAYTQIAQAASVASAAEAASETPTVWGKIAAITAMVGAFATMVSQVKSSVRTYADGGIVPGHNYNDGITARVSSGEMYINEADQKRLYNFIHSGGVGGGSVRSSITGEQIVIAVNNWARRTNRGELVFAGRG